MDKKNGGIKMKQQTKQIEKPYFEFSLDYNKDKDIWQTFSEIVDEANFTLTKDGLQIKTVDNALVCLLDYNIQLNNVEMNKEKIDFIVDIKLLTKILKLLSSYNSIKLKLDKNSLWISNKNTKFRIPLLDDTTHEIPDTSKFEWKTNFIISSDEFKDFIKKAELIGDAIGFEIKDGKLILSCENETMKVETQKEIGLKENVKKVLFPIDYLKKIKLKNEYRIWIKKDYPMKLEALDITYDYSKSNPKKILKNRWFTMLLAPRIESE